MLLNILKNQNSLINNPVNVAIMGEVIKSNSAYILILWGSNTYLIDFF